MFCYMISLTSFQQISALSRPPAPVVFISHIRPAIILFQNIRVGNTLYSVSHSEGQSTTSLLIIDIVKRIRENARDTSRRPPAQQPSREKPASAPANLHFDREINIASARLTR